MENDDSSLSRRLRVLASAWVPKKGVEALTGESEKLIGIEGKKALVTLVTYEASKQATKDS